jgi:thymidylate synthase
MNINQTYKQILKQIHQATNLVFTRNSYAYSDISGISLTISETPLVTVRKTAWSKAIKEMEWFLSGESECPNELKDWWDGQLNHEEKYLRGYGEQLIHYTTIDNESYSDKNSFNQIEWLIESIKNSPYSRRLITTTWHPKEMSNITEINKNPNTPTTCLPGWVNVLTKQGLKKLSDLAIGEHIWDGENYVEVINKFSQGVKDVYEYNTRKGSLFCTEEHKIFDGKKVKPIKDTQRLFLPDVNSNKNINLLPKYVLIGLLIADGTSNKSNKEQGCKLHIGRNDFDYFKSEIKNYIGKQTNIANPTEYFIKYNRFEIPCTWERKVPENILYGSEQIKKSFLRGYFSGNGYNSTTLYASMVSKKMVEDLQLMLHSLGIFTSINSSDGKKIKWKNGEYTSKKRYTITILKQHRNKFLQEIGFIQKYKQENRSNQLNRKYTKTAKIKNVKYYSTEEVFDITVNSEKHLFWCDGFLISNCHGTINQYFVRNNHLYITTYQRSCDMLLGCPHNWIQYWAFLLWLSYRTNLKPGSINWIYGDAHIYAEDSHLKSVNEILNSDDEFNQVELVYEPSSDSFKSSDFKIIGKIDKPVCTIRPKLL